jgi:hypothetical protein
MGDPSIPKPKTGWLIELAKRRPTRTPEKRTDKLDV